MNDDIYSIVERLAILEGRITPTSVKHGLNAQQQSVRQLPALFRPHDISPTLSKPPYQKHPMDGYLVGEATNEDESLEDRRDRLYRLLSQPGVDAETKAAAKEQLKRLEQPQDPAHWNFGSDSINEEHATEEKLLDKVKKSFIDYLDSVEDRVRKDGDLKTKSKDDGDLKKKEIKDRDLIAKIGRALDEDPTGEEPANTDLAPSEPVTNPTYSEPSPAAIKTMTMEDGRTCEIHGDERQGFEIRHDGRSLKSRFKDINQAEMAFEMYCARARARSQMADYLDEK